MSQNKPNFVLFLGNLKLNRLGLIVGCALYKEFKVSKEFYGALRAADGWLSCRCDLCKFFLFGFSCNAESIRNKLFLSK